jgi:zinc protease
VSPVDRSRAPQPQPGADRVAPKLYQWALEGADFVAVETAPRGLFELHLALDWGGFDEPAERLGLATLVADTLTRGTTTSSALALASRVECRGGSLDAGAGWERLVLSASGPSLHQDALLEVLFEVVAIASFPAAEVATARDRRLVDFARRLTRADTLADVALGRLLRAGRRDAVALAGLADTVAGLDAASVAAAFAGARLGRPVVVLAGLELDGLELAGEMARLAERLDRRLLDLGCGHQPRPRTPRPQLPEPSRRVVVVDLPEGSQTEIRLGHLGLGRLDPRRAEMLLLETVLGGAFSSRLNLELRERLALTYGARASFRAGRHDGTFEISAAVDTNRAGLAVARALEVCAQLRDEGPTSAEVASARQWRLGTIPYALQSLSSLAGRALEVGVLGLPSDDLERTITLLRDVTEPSVAELGGAVLTPQQAHIVVVGPARELVPQLDGFGPVEVVQPPDLEVWALES